MVLRAFGRLPPRYRWAIGTLALLAVAWVCMYGQLWCFDRYDEHRITARAMLTGTLRLRGAVGLTDHDEQVFNGAVYTNWGFGVPLLQLPFHALAGAVGLLHGFFPDRAIYFIYLAAATPVLWTALDRVFASRRPDVPEAQRQLFSWAATWLVLQVTLFPFMSTRFLVFEETLAYFTLCQLMAMSAYVFAMGTTRLAPVLAMGIAAGLGLVVRPTGVVYVGVWGLLVLLQGRMSRTAVFALAVAPLAAFWVYSNEVRTGSAFGLGYVNANPGWDFDMHTLRFGGQCADSALHTLQVAARVFAGFFLCVWRDPGTDWLRECHCGFEERDRLGIPFFGPAILVLLAGLLYRLVSRRERRLALYIPFAAMAVLFAGFVQKGWVAWRYVGDFWPLVVLACVDYTRTQPQTSLAPFDARHAKIMFWAGVVALGRFLFPWEGSTRAEVLSVRDAATMADDFRESRWARDPPMPSRLACGDALGKPYNNGKGWNEGCRVGTFTNVYLGVPAKDGSSYELRLRTEGIEGATLRVYLNGKMITARRQADGYAADVDLDRAALWSPVVVTTVEWTSVVAPAHGKLLSIELA